MKKTTFHAFLYLVILSAVLCFAFSASAEIFDLSVLSDDEVVELLNKVNEEIAARNLNKTAIVPAGAYIAGKDIPAGSYIYTCLATGDDWGNLTVYSDAGKGEQLFWEIVGAADAGEEPETFFITLSNNDELESGVPFSLTIFSGIQFN